MAFFAAVLLGTGLAIEDTFLFLYPQSEAVNWLFANVYLGETKFVLREHFLACYQNINLLITGLLIPAAWLHLPPYSALWLWQSVFNTLLLFRAAQLLHNKDNSQHTAISYALFYGNPLLWYGLLWMPSQVVMAWLVIEWQLNRKRNVISANLSLLVLSFCGSLGFVTAFILCGITLIFNRLMKENDTPSSYAGCVSVIPAIMFYLIQSINTQTGFGAYLINAPSPLVDWMSFSWLTFQAHENLKFYLLWLGNGGAVWWVPLPLFGFLSLTGIIQKFGQKTQRLHLALTCVSVTVLIILTLPVAQDEYTNAALVLLLFLIPYTTSGLIHWLSSLPSFKLEATGIAILAVLFLGWFRQPVFWHQHKTHASLLFDISQNIETILATNRHENSRVALPYHPSLLASVHSGVEIIPLQLAIQQSITTINGGISGVRLQLTQALSLQPKLCILFPEEALPIDQSNNSLLSVSHNQTILETYYQKSSLKQLTYYKQTYPEQYHDDLNLNLVANSSWVLSQDTYEIIRNQTYENPDRITWDFEDEFTLVDNTGFAFGSSPSRKISAVGSGAAVSGMGENARLMGMLQSKPFVIQGDDLRFYAKMPANASPTIFCLAVQQKISANDLNHPPLVEHAFDHQPGQSLAADTSFYIKPEELHYESDGIYGWKVVRILHGGDQPGWQQIEWSLLPWKGKQAVWLAADRDRQSWMAIDHITQIERPSGLYWDFETGTYESWLPQGDAFAANPAYQPLGEQLQISGYEGNYFLNSFFDGEDLYTGSIQSPPFEITHKQISFLVGGGNDINNVYVALEVDGKTVLRATGLQSETLHPVQWDLSNWQGKTARIIVTDQATGVWGHILADDFRVMQ